MIPSEFVCPLTKDIMSDPMVTRYGVRFEKKAIMEWLDAGNTFCPVTKNPLRISNLISDKNLKWKIQYWAEKNGCADKLTTIDDSNASIVVKVAIPDDRFICPLTKDIMKEPMVSRYGHNFEKTAILTLLDKNNSVCPVTKKPLLPSDLVSNHKLTWEISQWHLQFGEAYDEETQKELNSKLTKAKMVSQGYGSADIIKALIEDDETESETESPAELNASNPNVLSCLDEVIGTIE